MEKRKIWYIIPVVGIFLLITYFVLASPSLIDNQQWGWNLTGIRYGALAYGDLDKDNYSDLVLTGCLNAGGSRCNNGVVAKIYTNNGSSFNENQSWQFNLTGVGWSSLALGDINNDAYLDLVSAGCLSAGDVSCDGGAIIKVYTNNGTSLNENISWQQNLTGVWQSSIALGDINRDGYKDLLLTGKETDDSVTIKSYINNGTSFNENQGWGQNLTAVYNGNIILGYLDNDNFLDLALSGRDSSSNDHTEIYLNNGTALLRDTNWDNNLQDATFSSLIWGDWDNDGLVDLVLNGIGDYLRVYANNGSTLVENQTNEDGILAGVYQGSLAFGDYDNDGDLDIVAAGLEDNRNRIYFNNYTKFLEDATAQNNITKDIIKGSVLWVDIDTDLDLDLIMVGSAVSLGQLVNKVYISNQSLNKTNDIPYTPTSFENYTAGNGNVFFGWNNGSDNETPSLGLYYNLKIGTSSRGNEIVSGIFGGSSGGGGGGGGSNGYFGNMMQRRNISLQGSRFQVGTTYYWSVQTIDTGLAKSAWSDEQEFTPQTDFTPPVNTINALAESWVTNSTIIIFNVTVYDETNLSNVSLYGNWSGGWHSNETNSSGINNTDYIFNKTISEGQYMWGIRSCDVSANCYGANRTFRIDTTNPQLKLMAPTNASSWTTSNTIKFVYNVTDLTINNCSLIVNGIVNYTNTSISLNVTQNFTSVLPNGRYNWSVRCTDAANNINASYNYSLTVNYQAGNGDDDGTTTSGGGGGGTSTTTTTAKISRLVPTIVEGENRIEFTESEKETVGVEEIIINTKTEAVNVKISIEKIESKPSEVETAPPGSTYTYLKIDKTNLQDSDIKEAKIKFTVNKTWMTKNNYMKEDIVLNRLNTKWTKLPTAFLKSDNKLYYYESTTPSFSYFAVTVEEEETPQAEEETISEEEEKAPEKPTPQPHEGILKEQETKLNLVWLWIVLGIIAVAIAVTLVIMKQKRRAAKKKH